MTISVTLKLNYICRFPLSYSTCLFDILHTPHQDEKGSTHPRGSQDHPPPPSQGHVLVILQTPAYCSVPHTFLALLQLFQQPEITWNLNTFVKGIRAMQQDYTVKAVERLKDKEASCSAASWWPGWGMEEHPANTHPSACSDMIFIYAFEAVLRQRCVVCPLQSAVITVMHC